VIYRGDTVVLLDTHLLIETLHTNLTNNPSEDLKRWAYEIGSNSPGELRRPTLTLLTSTSIISEYCSRLPLEGFPKGWSYAFEIFLQKYEGDKLAILSRRGRLSLQPLIVPSTSGSLKNPRDHDDDKFLAALEFALTKPQWKDKFVIFGCRDTTTIEIYNSSVHKNRNENRFTAVGNSMELESALADP